MERLSNAVFLEFPELRGSEIFRGGLFLFALFLDDDEEAANGSASAGPSEPAGIIIAERRRRNPNCFEAFESMNRPGLFDGTG
jgi:hypothetical protein